MKKAAHFTKYDGTTNEIIEERDCPLNVTELIDTILEVWPFCSLICKSDGTRIMLVWFCEEDHNNLLPAEYKYIIKSIEK